MKELFVKEQRLNMIIVACERVHTPMRETKPKTKSKRAKRYTDIDDRALANGM